MARFEGELAAGAGRIAIVVSRYNDFVTNRLLEGTQETLRKNGQSEDRIDVIWVPGAFEISLMAWETARSGRYVAVICLGAVIRGETSHDQHINRAVGMGIAEASWTTGVPVSFGVLTCDSVEQALHRAGGNAGNKGEEAAEAALRMADLLRQLSFGHQPASTTSS